VVRGREHKGDLALWIWHNAPVATRRIRPMMHRLIIKNAAAVKC